MATPSCRRSCEMKSGSVPKKKRKQVRDFRGESSPSRKDGHREDGGSSGDTKEKPGAESIIYFKTEAALPPTSQDISYLPKGKVADTNVTRQALRGSKAAVNRRSADAPPAPLPCTSSSPWVLEQILCLQQ
ncbi:hypothetical protein J1605_007690 [Eschrichtius robustus]|uniref:Uncharacterized protein n=1 Tax=Eschrichtius robustus TaxID=9764 RepID=A0AB34H355_ESCRO|nr:hypothetical protein J1605_007690 [Eschrichtius robustus]